MNRRNFLKTVGVGAGAALVGSEIGGDVLRALAAPADAQPADPVWHVLNRVTFGPRPGQVEAVKKMGLSAYLTHQLAPAQIDDPASDKHIADFASLNMDISEMISLLGNNGDGAIRELDSATILRSIYSERQLFEVMTNFWSEHFSIWHGKDLDRIFKTVDDREVVRPFALGKFRDILGASAKSPAMLIYLDNAKSEKKHPNENYAREVMELHTITIGNYTEDDVKEVARCFTGWTIQGQNGDHPGAFVFNPKLHDDGEKTVLGQKIPAGGGIKDGELVLDMLAAHPAAAHHISSKLARRFIADDPPENVVQACVTAFQQSGGDIPTVLRVIFSSPEFMSAPPKYKRPYEFLISLFRALDVQFDKLNPAILTEFKAMGHLPFDHITPDGYTDYASLWESNMLPRWNAAINVVYGHVPNAKVDLKALASSQNVQLTPQAMLDFFAQHLYGRPLAQTESDVFTAFMNKGGAPDLTKPAGQNRMLDTIALMVSAPAFQFR